MFFRRGHDVTANVRCWLNGKPLQHDQHTLLMVTLGGILQHNSCELWQFIYTARVYPSGPRIFMLSSFRYSSQIKDRPCSDIPKRANERDETWNIHQSNLTIRGIPNNRTRWLAPSSISERNYSHLPRQLSTTKCATKTVREINFLLLQPLSSLSTTRLDSTNTQQKHFCFYYLRNYTIVAQIVETYMWGVGSLSSTQTTHTPHIQCRRESRKTLLRPCRRRKIGDPHSPLSELIHGTRWILPHQTH